MMSDMDRKKISKTMSYLLRHDPEGMDIDHEGWVAVGQLLERLNRRDVDLEREDLKAIVERDPKGRYELSETRIRARYGHSIDDIDPILTPASADKLYHGTSPDVVDRILSEGLRKQGRQKVHLSSSVEEARKVGRRHTKQPIILCVNASKAQEEGVRIERASHVVFVADEIPPEFLCRLD